MSLNAAKHSFCRSKQGLYFYEQLSKAGNVRSRSNRFDDVTFVLISCLDFVGRSSDLFSHWSISLNGRTVVIRGLMVADDGGNRLEGVTISRARRFPPQGFIIDRNIYTCSKFVGNSILRGLRCLISLLTSTASSSKTFSSPQTDLKTFCHSVRDCDVILLWYHVMNCDWWKFLWRATFDAIWRHPVYTIKENNSIFR